MLPVRAQHALVDGSRRARASVSAATFSGATNTCTRPRPSSAERPVRQRHERLGRDPAATRGRGEAAAELADPVLAERQHHLAEVRIRRAVGDHEMEEAALAPARLVERHHAGAVGRGSSGTQRAAAASCSSARAASKSSSRKGRSTNAVPASGGSRIGNRRCRSRHPMFHPSRAMRPGVDSMKFRTRRSCLCCPGAAGSNRLDCESRRSREASEREESRHGYEKKATRSRSGRRRRRLPRRQEGRAERRRRAGAGPADRGSPGTAGAAAVRASAAAVRSAPARRRRPRRPGATTWSHSSRT